MATTVTLIDNYDSFTFNLAHYLGELGAEVAVVRNDSESVDDVLARGADAIVLSPGPGEPRDAGVMPELIRRAREDVPMLGVCLGHQAIGESYGGAVVRATPMHGKVSEIRHGGRSVFRGVNGPFKATRYHSLVVERATMPADVEITAETDDGLVMALAHRRDPVHGVQFHPESIASEHGKTMLANFLAIARDFRAALA